MLPVLIKYPLDKTGVNPNNLVSGEQITLNNKRVRSIAPMYGAFYADSVVMIDLANNTALVRDIDWYPGELYETPTALFGKGIYGIIVINNPLISSTVLLTYQAVGGEYSDTAGAIAQLVTALDSDTRQVFWPNILHKPEMFPPSQHLHDIGDVYGFEYMVHALERIKVSIEIGDAASHNEIYQYIDRKIDILVNSGDTNADISLFDGAAG